MDVLSTSSPDISQCKIEMIFRFWSPSVNGGESGERAKTITAESGVLALIEDVVATRQGILRTANDQLFASALKHPADALVVSRQVQLGLQGFRSNGAQPLAVSIAIDAVEAPDSSAGGNARPNEAGDLSVANGGAQPSHDLFSLLRLSKPAQILVTHALCERMGGLKGLPLRSFPGRFGVNEYLWTSEEELELLQSEPQLPLDADPHLPLSQIAPGSPESQNAASEVPAIVGPSLELPANEQTIHLTPRLQTIQHDPKWWVIAAALLVIVVAGVWGISGALRRSSQPRATVPLSRPETTPAAPPIVVPNPPAPHVKTVIKSQTPTVKPAAANADATSSSQNTRQATPAEARRGACQIDGGDLPRYLAMAERDREAGNYSAAERLFQEVLGCDPGNADARRGLMRTKGAEEQGR